MNIHKKILEKHGITQSSPQVQIETQSPMRMDQKAFLERLQECSRLNSHGNVFMTSTVFPKSISVKNDAKIPLAVCIQPYGESVYNSFPQASSTSVIRCDSCRAYVNPFMEFKRAGQDMKCNLCGWVSALPQSYVCSLDPQSGKRTDCSQLPELSQGSIDIRAGQDYQARPPMPPTYLFLVDVSQSASHILDLFANTLKEIMNSNLLMGGERTMFGLITYDTGVQLYHFRNGSRNAQVIHISDLSELELPVPNELLVNLTDANMMVIDLLNGFGDMHRKSQVPHATAFNKALEFARLVMGSIGGKLIIIAQGDKINSDPYLTTKTEEEKRNYQLPSSVKISEICSDMHISFICPSIFIFSKTFANTITLCELSKYLNGDAFYYQNDEITQRKFYYDLTQVLTKEYIWESVYRLRVSTGFRLKQIYGNFSIKSNDLLNMTCMDDFKSITYQIEHQDGVCRTDTLFIQSALLYTSSRGERRIRVHNYAIPLTVDANCVIEHASSTNITNFLLKQVLHKLYREPNIPSIRQFIIEQGQTMLCNAMIMLKGIPDSLAHLPLQLLALLKHPILTNIYSPNTSTDAVNVLRLYLNACSPNSNYIVPILYRIEDMLDQDCCVLDEQGVFIYPLPHQLSLQTLSDYNGVYLMDLVDDMIIYITKQHDQMMAEDILGPDYWNIELNEDMLYFNSLNPINALLAILINELRSHKYSKYSPIRIVKQGDNSPYEQMFLANLLLDDMNSKYRMSYESFYKLLMK